MILNIFFFFYDFSHVYSRRSGPDNPRGQKFDVNRKALSHYPFVAIFKEISYTFFFNYLIHAYSPRTGDTQSPGDNVNRNILSFRSSVASFKS